MPKSSLIVVHPGYYAAGHAVGHNAISSYGDYQEYTSSLSRAVRSQPSAVLLYRKDATPPGLRGATHILSDRLGACDVDELVSVLRKDKVEAVGVCGEFLWWYGVADITQNIKNYTKKLPEEKRRRLVEVLKKTQILDARVAKRAGLDEEEFTKEIFHKGQSGFQPGCVVQVYKELQDKFPIVGVVRELSYPTIDPQIITV